MFRFIFIIAGVFAASLALSGPVTELREHRFRVVGERALRGVFYEHYTEAKDGFESLPLRFRSQGRSPYYHYKGPPVLTFHRRQGEDEWRTVGTLELPSGPGPSLLLFTDTGRGQSAEHDYIIHCLPDDGQTLPPGHLVIYNTMEVTFSAALRREEDLDAEKMLIPPGLAIPVFLGNSADLALGLTLDDGSYHGLLEETLHASEDERLLLLLFPPLIPGGLDVRSMLLRDYVFQ